MEQSAGVIFWLVCGLTVLVIAFFVFSIETGLDDETVNRVERENEEIE
jgi:TM2 domain-containing membrane protein YozV